MSIVTLVSGGLDSTVMAALCVEEKIFQFPLFINYGQRAYGRELAACRNAMASIGVSEPRVANLAGYGELIRSGLTDTSLDVVEHAFTPGRNALFLLIAGSYAATVQASSISIGLLDEKYRLFPDQSKRFIEQCEEFLSCCLGRGISVKAPLMSMSKRDVIEIARVKGLRGLTYSCHLGTEKPCGTCIACLEFEGMEV